jgi:hypothetical protein
MKTFKEEAAELLKLVDGALDAARDLYGACDQDASDAEDEGGDAETLAANAERFYAAVDALETAKQALEAIE